ncbi:hypothetical protein K438DRAFT_1959781 [Mycena galopus ATCC 62051]|nr:hypothetical protein K438DRAFT_1959781 [Mycena galopus ATCC 62051]
MADTLDWATALRTILLAQNVQSNLRSWKYPSGHTLSIIRDLETGSENHTTRFINIDHAGLSGVIFYPIPARRPSVPDEHAIDSEVENAIEILYFPMASTSFVTGQVMKAHLLSDAAICPKPHVSGSGFSLNSRALEALARALAGDSAVPIRDLFGELKPTPQCADRVLKDRRDAARQLLVMRYRNFIRNIPRDPLRKARVPTASTLIEEIKLAKLFLNSCDAKKIEVHESPAVPQYPLTLRSNAAIPTAANHTLPPALRSHRHANTLSAVVASIDPQNIEKKHFKVLASGRRKGKENDFV